MEGEEAEYTPIVIMEMLSQWPIAQKLDSKRRAERIKPLLELMPRPIYIASSYS